MCTDPNHPEQNQATNANDDLANARPPEPQPQPDSSEPSTAEYDDGVAPQLQHQ